MKLPAIRVLLLTSVLLLAACGTAPAVSDAPQPAATDTQPLATSQSEPITLTVAMEIGSAADERTKLLQEQFTQYTQEHPNVMVKFESFVGNYDDYLTKLLVDLKAGVGPDIFTTTGPTLLQFSLANTILVAPPEVEAYVKQEALNEAVVNSVTMPDGKMYGLPWIVGTPALYYNVDMYKEAGISKPPTTWEELVTTAQKLTKVDAQGNLVVAGFFVRKSGSQLGIFEKWYPFFTAAGGKVFNDDMTQATLNSPAGVEALQFYVDLIHKYHVDSFEALEGDTAGFIAGNVAQYFREPPNIAAFQQSAPDLHFGTALLPDHTAPAKGFANVDAIAVTKASKNPEAAWDFLMWLSSPTVGTHRAKTSLTQPLFKSVASDSFFKENELMQPFLQQEADAFPLHPKAYDIESAIGGYIEKALHQQLTPQQALDAAVEDVNQLLGEK